MKHRFLTKKIHPYYFTVFGCMGIIVGILLALLLPDQQFSMGSWLVISLFLVAISYVKFRRFFVITIFVAGLILGLWRMSIYELGKQNFRNFIGQTKIFVGQVSDDVNYGPGGDLRFKLNNLRVDGHKIKGEMWLSTREDLRLKRSDQVTVKGKINEGFGGFSASMSGVDVIEITNNSKNDLGLIVRDKFSEKTDKIDQPGRVLGLGFLVGQKNDLPEDLAKKVKNLGLSHMIVASGYNLTILVVFARRLFAKISKYLSAVFGGVMIGGFMLITGFSPSMSRAGLVAGMSLIAWYYGRKIHPVVLLLISASITLVIKPSYIWGDLGWYLSFLAFIGVLILAPLIHDYFWGKAKPSAIRELVITTVCAQIMTLPILIYSFGLFSAWSLIANILILPIVPLAMLAVFVSGLAGILIPFMSGILSVPANLILKYCIFVIDKIAGLPSAVSEVSLSISYMILAYVLLLVGIIWLKLKTKHNFISDKNIVD